MNLSLRLRKIIIFIQTTNGNKEYVNILLFHTGKSRKLQQFTVLSKYAFLDFAYIFEQFNILIHIDVGIK